MPFSNEQLEDRIIASAETGDLKGLNTAIKQLAANYLRPKRVTAHFLYKFNMRTIAEIGKHLAARNNIALIKAAHNGHLKVLNRLLQFKSVAAAVAAQDNAALRYAAAKGRELVVKRLLQFEAVVAAATANNNQALLEAVKNGHIKIVRLLLEIPEVREHAAVLDNLIFRSAVQNGHKEVQELLLNLSDVFKYAALNDQVYGATLSSFINNYCTKLEGQINVYDSFLPGSFDFPTDENRRLGFYILRYMLNSDNPEYSKHIEMLSKISSLALMNNALARNSPESFDPFAPRMPLPALAPEDIEEALDDSENSMLQLTPSEKKVLANVKQVYDPELQARAGANNRKKIDTVINELRAYIEVEYARHPATVTLGSGTKKTTITLPLTWHDFQAMCSKKGIALGTDDYNKLLVAYYNNESHTAYRLFLKPNKWVDVNSRWTETCAGGKYTNIERFKSDIAYLWLAVSDRNEGGEKITQARIKTFVFLLGRINRGHNEDTKVDNNLPDDPSCSPGVLRRLFEGVVDHSLFVPSVEARATEKIRHFVQNYYKEIFESMIKDPQQSGTFKNIYHSVVDLSNEDNCFINNSGYPQIVDIDTQALVKFLQEIQTEHLELYEEVQKRITPLLQLKDNQHIPQNGHFFTLYETYNLALTLQQAHNNLSINAEKVRRSGP